MACRPPGSSVHGILQARTLEWAAMPSSSGPSWPWESNTGLLHWHADSSSPRRLGIAKKKKKNQTLKLFNTCRRVWLVYAKKTYSFISVFRATVTWKLQAYSCKSLYSNPLQDGGEPGGFISVTEGFSFSLTQPTIKINHLLAQGILWRWDKLCWFPSVVMVNFSRQSLWG